MDTGGDDENISKEGHMREDPYLSQSLTGVEQNSINSHSVAGIFENRIWTVDEVSAFLRVSRGHVYNLVSRREIPYRKRGNILRFFAQEILDWLDEGV